MNCRIILLICFISSCSHIVVAGWWPFNSYESHNQEMNTQQARRYIHDVVTKSRHILGKYISHHRFNELEIALETTVKQSASGYFFDTFYISRDLLNQYIQSGIIDLIEHHCFDYAYEHLKNHPKAQAIAESMRNNAIASISQHGFDPRNLVPFVSNQLKQAVKNSTHHAQQVYSDRLYPSEFCCICTESFDEVTRIFLHPCGHDVCTHCALQWFFANSLQDRTCPLCRAKVNVEQLSQDLNHTFF